MGYTIYGYCKAPDNCDLSLEGAKVYPYFKKVDSDSPNSKWTDEAYETDGESYYTFDLNDQVMLGSEAEFKKGKDKVYLAIVYGGGGKLDSTDITRALFIEHTTKKGEDTWEINLNLELTRSPVISNYSMPDAILTQHEYMMSEESYADTGWVNNGCYDVDVAQKLVYDGENIFDGHQLIKTIYDWGEIDAREVANNSSNKYIFKVAGDYTIKIKVREKWGTYTEVTKDVRIKYNEPNVDFDWSPTETNNGKIKGQEEITFHNKTNDIDGRTHDHYTFKWEIEDANQDDTDNSDTYEDKDDEFEPTKKFQSEGDKKVKLTCYWNDGFDDLEVSTEKIISIYPFVVDADFHWDDDPHNRGQDVEFDPSDTSGDTDQISKYDWTMEDNYPAPNADANLYTFADDEDSKYGEGSPDNSQRVDNAYDIDDTEKPVVKFHSDEDKEVEVVITYSDGWKDVTSSKKKIITPTVDSLNLAIKLDRESPISREEEVTITDDTVDDNELQYTVDWIINDYYAKYNPDSSDYGNSEVDNTVEISNVSPTDEQKHKFQSKAEHEIKLIVRYDNGWQMFEDEVIKKLAPTEYIVNAGIITDPEPVDNGFVGKVEVTYKNNSTGDGVGRMIDEDWSWDDIEEDGTRHVTIREDEAVNSDQIFTYQYVSRKPYSAVDGATEQNINKEVKLVVRYDNGWEDVMTSKVAKHYEASPYEIEGSITVSCNVDGYTHGGE